MNRLKIMLLLAPAALLGACSQVDAGEVGIWNSFGALDKNTVGPGLHWYNPALSELKTMSIKSLPYNAATEGYTKDSQTGTIKFNVVTSLQPSAAVRTYTAYKQEWRETLVPPSVLSTIKDVFGQFTAQQAISQRPLLQARILQALQIKFAKKGINVESFQITDLKYSEAFEDSVEKAQVATQSAIAAKNHTVEVEEEAKQTMITATAEAEKTRVVAQAITSNPAIVQLRAVEKWDGVLPQNMYGSAPLPFVGGATK